MTVKDKLTQLQTGWNSLQTKIKTKLTTLNQTVTERSQLAEQKNNQLIESNRKLELQMKESAENEKVLEQLLKEFKELEESL